jgi:penicillin-binding protein 2
MIQKLIIGRGLLFLLISTGFGVSQMVIAAAPPISHTKCGRPIESHHGIPTFAESALDDITADDDHVVRQAALRALGAYNGSVVAIDPSNGRILSIVNQKLAFSVGFIPCSTIKPVIALAALNEGFVARDALIRASLHRSISLIEAIAHSNNKYFEELGRRMGFETVSAYARMLGLGELSGYKIPEEQPGKVPDKPPKRGGVRRMSSFGEGIQMTPLQLGALASTLANGGTLYYLQYPRTIESKDNFEPRIKRTFEMDSPIEDVREGMLAAVLHGTARRSYISDDEQAPGKTGSCSDQGTRIGWFVSFADQVNPKMVLVILMRGQKHIVQGPMAAGIAGRIYRKLHDENYFARDRGGTGVQSITSLTSQNSSPGTSRPPNSILDVIMTPDIIAEHPSLH